MVENAKTLRVSYLQFDVHGVSGQKFFTDKRVRQAVAHAINRESLTKNLVGPASVVAHAPCHPDQFACSSDVPKYAYDPAKAKALLKEAGFADGFEFELFAYRDREYTEAVIGDLAKVGIKPKLNYVQYTAFVEDVHKGRTPDRARHLGLQLGARRVGHDRAFLPARARRPDQGPRGQEADRGGRRHHRSRQAQGGLAEGARPHRRGGLLGAAVHLRQILRLLQGPRLHADLGRDPAVLRREMEMRDGSDRGSLPVQGLAEPGRRSRCSPSQSSVWDVALLVALTVSLITFSMIYVSGDPAIAIAGEGARAQDIEAIRKFYGFDRPIVGAVSSTG